MPKVLCQAETVNGCFRVVTGNPKAGSAPVVERRSTPDAMGIDVWQPVTADCALHALEAVVGYFAAADAGGDA